MFLKLYNVHLNTPLTSIRSLKTRDTFKCKLLAEGTLKHEYNTKQKTLILFGYLDTHVTYTHPFIS